MKRSFKILHDDGGKGRKSSDASEEYSPAHALHPKTRAGNLAFNAPLNAVTTNSRGTDPDTQEYADTTQVKRQYLSQDESSFHMFNLQSKNDRLAEGSQHRAARSRATAIDADPDLMNSQATAPHATTKAKPGGQYLRRAPVSMVTKSPYENSDDVIEQLNVKVITQDSEVLQSYDQPIASVSPINMGSPRRPRRIEVNAGNADSSLS